jgi:serine phosphatase RsbU (regulator of sigma subunit)
VVTTFVDFDDHTITYSSAGHPPPALLHPDGRVEFLDRATDPPLDARPDPMPRPQARTPASHRGATLVLYTDGLIERRPRTSTRAWPASPTPSPATGRLDPEALADALLPKMSWS